MCALSGTDIMYRSLNCRALLVLFSNVEHPAKMGNMLRNGDILEQ